MAAFNFGGGSFDPEADHGDDEHTPPTRGRARRAGASAEVFNDEDLDTFVAPVHAKSEEVASVLRKVLEDHHLFAHLDDKEIETIVLAMKERKVRSEGSGQGGEGSGAPFLEAGSEGDGNFYIITEGKLEVGGETRGRGRHFGELQLLHQRKTQLTVRVLNNATLYYIDRGTCQQVRAKSSRARRKKYGGFLRKLSFLKDLQGEALNNLADALKTSDYNSDEHLINFDDEGKWFHLIVEGTVEVVGRDKTGANRHVCCFEAGDCVGELEFIHNHRCVADVVARGPVKTAKMNRHDFELTMGPVKELLEKNASESNVYEYYRGTQSGADAAGGARRLVCLGGALLCATLAAMSLRRSKS